MLWLAKYRSTDFRHSITCKAKLWLLIYNVYRKWPFDILVFLEAAHFLTPIYFLWTSWSFFTLYIPVYICNTGIINGTQRRWHQAIDRASKSPNISILIFNIGSRSALWVTSASISWLAITEVYLQIVWQKQLSSKKLLQFSSLAGSASAI